MVGYEKCIQIHVSTKMPGLEICEILRNKTIFVWIMKLTVVINSVLLCVLQPFQPNKLDDDIINIPVHVTCESAYQTYWIGALLVKDALILVFGVFLAWETRNVTVPALNDSKLIGKSSRIDED